MPIDFSRQKNAVEKLIATWRMYKVKKLYENVRYAIVTIQRSYRLHRSKKAKSQET